jgi:hypothetical protein
MQSSFFMRRRSGDLRAGAPHAVFASLHPWHELLVPEPLVLGGRVLAPPPATRRLRSSPLQAPMESAEDGQSDEDANTCAICLSAVDKDGDVTMGVATLHCGHKFHPCCIASWLSQSSERRCPLCRAIEGSALESQGGNGGRRPGRSRSLFVTARNLLGWLILHNECFSMVVSYGFDRAMQFTGSPILSIGLSAGWLVLLSGLLPSPRIEQNPMQYLLGVRNTPRVLRMWTSWL